MSQKSSIEWCESTWNPINGRCPNNCDYCYMWGKGGIADRFKKVHDHPLRLDQNVLAKIPKKGRVFVGSATDMWVDEIPDEWIRQVLTVCEDTPNVTFLFLTKKPKRYLTLPLSEIQVDNMWFGTTWDGTPKTWGNITDLAELANFGFNTFVSFEPLLAEPHEHNISLDYTTIKWIIIGADSRKGKPKPPKEWAAYLIEDARRNGAKVFIKDNYGYPEIIKEIHES